MKITIISDNTVHKHGLKKEWGFSCLVEAEHTSKILFDTGARGSVLLHEEDMSKENHEIVVHDENFKEEVIGSKIPVLVDFWAEWCAPCLMIAQAVESVAETYKGKLKVCKLNVDQAQNIASQYNVMSIPTLMIFKNGSVVDTFVGVMPEKEIEARIKQFVG